MGFDIYDVVLGGLLHDIGKLYMKGGNDGDKVAGLTICKEHPIISADFVEKHRGVLYKAGFNVDAVKEFVQRHHEGNLTEKCLVSGAKSEYKGTCLKISRADNYSSSERLGDIGGLQGGNPGDDGNNYRTRTLASVFSAVAPDGKLYSHVVGKYGTHLAKISNTHRINTFDKNKEFIEEFDKSFAELNAESKEEFIDKANKLLHSYAWCFPSDVTKIYKDVSLYDHLKTTGAIAQTLFNSKASIDAIEKTEACIVQLQVVGESDFITDTSNYVGVLGIDVIKANDKIVSSQLTGIIKDAKEAIPGFTNCNVIIRRKFSTAIIISKADIDKLENIILQRNKLLAYDTDLKCYIEYAYETFNVSNFGNTADMLSDIRKSLQGMAVNSSIKVVGLESILSNKGKWVADIDIEDSLRERNIGTDNLANNTYAMVKVTISNINDIMNNMVRISSHKIIGWAKNPNYDKPDEILNYGSISRVSTIYGIISTLLSIESWIKCTIIHQSNDEVSFIIDFDTFIHKFYKYLELLNRASANSMKVVASIRTFTQADDIERIYGSLSEKHDRLLKTTKESAISYNSVRITLDDLKRIETIQGWIIKSLELEKSPLYKSMEFIQQYKQSLKTHELPMCIPRFSYTQARIFSNDTIDKNIASVIKEGFNAIKSGKKPSNVFMVLDTLIHDTL